MHSPKQRTGLDLDAMGLAGTKRRRKLALDPNNTKWTRDTTTFGQKILRAQGWEPGQFLGAQDASHATFHTAASSAPIKIALKDDTRGLGAKIPQKQSDECTGLDVFKDLLGRLNGKSSETIEKERQVRNEMKTSLYVERRFGPMMFIKGGLLVGDQIQSLVNKQAESKTPNAEVVEAEAEAQAESPAVSVPAADADGSSKPKKEKKSKKRRAVEIDDEDTIQERKKKKKRSKDSSPSEDTVIEDLEKKKKKSKKSKVDLEEEGGDDSGDVKSKSKKSKKRKAREGVEDDEQVNNTVSDADLKNQSLENLVGSEEKKKDKKAKKEKKKKRKHLDSSETPAESESPTEPSVSSITETPTPQESGASTPVGTGTSTPRALTGRHLVRSRYIASKRMATDMQSLNQIFMVKPV